MAPNEEWKTKRTAVLVSNIAKAIEEEEIHEYFSYYAPIAKLTMLDCNPSGRKKAVILFDCNDLGIFDDWQSPGGLLVEYIRNEGLIVDYIKEDDDYYLALETLNENCYESRGSDYSIGKDLDSLSGEGKNKMEATNAEQGSETTLLHSSSLIPNIFQEGSDSVEESEADSELILQNVVPTKNSSTYFHISVEDIQSFGSNEELATSAIETKNDFDYVINLKSEITSKDKNSVNTVCKLVVDESSYAMNIAKGLLKIEKFSGINMLRAYI